MKQTVLLLSLSIFCWFSARAHAGNIYGSLWLDRKPAEGAKIVITCGNNPPHRAQTDNHGSYRVFVRERDRCVFSVRLGGKSGQTEIASYDDAIKYDFNLVPQGDGYDLRRK
jgi:hypothetical protein